MKEGSSLGILGNGRKRLALENTFSISGIAFSGICSFDGKLIESKGRDDKKKL
jgi:roadblock/LC7 domain-containing protein